MSLSFMFCYEYFPISIPVCLLNINNLPSATFLSYSIRYIDLVSYISIIKFA